MEPGCLYAVFPHFAERPSGSDVAGGECDPARVSSAEQVAWARGKAEHAGAFLMRLPPCWPSMLGFCVPAPCCYPRCDRCGPGVCDIERDPARRRGAADEEALFISAPGQEWRLNGGAEGKL
ncbi:hypothetical protein SKAU_G00317660 [Synaphobranchus kaupii]|uniref:Uncharacterized protein n=1 Tax=Synaphobranchus kaupii TaxID=118154 RepID=A0A9Q1ET10_SYNKA|nr:hypothetical protein SKAU_G00317660 [Synaphobranchus kaupii]